MTARSETNEDAQDDEAPDDHFEDVEDGAGCTEIWEHLSRKRDSNADDD